MHQGSKAARQQGTKAPRHQGTKAPGLLEAWKLGDLERFGRLEGLERLGKARSLKA